MIGYKLVHVNVSLTFFFPEKRNYCYIYIYILRMHSIQDSKLCLYPAIAVVYEGLYRVLKISDG